MTDFDYLVENALRRLRDHGLPIAEATSHVSPVPGLYAIHADETVWIELGLEWRGGLPLYVGKAEDSLVARDIRTHFGAGRTGTSTIRRSFAALLREQLDLRGQPRNPENPGHFSNFGLPDADDARLSTWMNEKLRISVWAKPETDTELVNVETAVIRAWEPPINIAKNPRKDVHLQAVRRAMADEARGWASERGL
ncbi:GIY-YIG nuclease family protein [Leifsonia sp. YIM 134122]|uniref:GIY-YIG nuclease family protein n=1 Tax=Leifsonia stereocauli TaxID=3134136 RepID=A0ABU9W0G3_9MICO